MSSPKPNPKYTVLYDGQCEMCSALMNKVGDSKQQAQFCPIDLNKAPLPNGITKEAAKKEIHVVTADGQVYKNAAAVAQIMSVYPLLKSAAKLIDYQPFNWIATRIYNFVAAHRHSLFGDIGRLFWVKAILGTAFITGILLSLPLWTGDSALPAIPAFSFLPELPVSLSIGLLVTLVISLFDSIFTKKQRYYLCTALGALGILLLFDQLRWQPWVYQYGFMLLALAFFSWKPKDAVGRIRTLAICQLIIVSIYFFSGLHKINIEFMTSVFPWMLEPFTNLLPLMWRDNVAAAGSALVPFIEAGLGLSLLVPKLRKWAVLGLIGMHLSILVLLGPLGQNWNYVVWPWNVAMIGMVIALFYNARQTAWDILIPKSVLHAVVAVLFGLLPALSFANLWDSYLSHSLYSGDITTGTIYATAQATSQLPPAYARNIQDAQGAQAVSIQQLSFDTHHVPLYPEVRIYKKVAKELCATTGNTDLTLHIEGKKSWWRDTGVETFTCEQL